MHARATQVIVAVFASSTKAMKVGRASRSICVRGANRFRHNKRTVNIQVGGGRAATTFRKDTFLKLC